MTTTAPLVLTPDTRTPTGAAWDHLLKMADDLVKSGLLPAAIKTAQAAAAIILKGRELGIPAMQAFAHIHIIDGKPTCSSELMLALLARGGVTYRWLEDGRSGQAAIEFQRTGFGPVRGTFSKAEATEAGLLDKLSWKRYPANMLRARAVSNGARMLGPDLLAGMSYTPEELGAEVDEDEQPLPVEATGVWSTSPGNGRRTGKKEPPRVRFLRRCGELMRELGGGRFNDVLEREFGGSDPASVGADDTETMASIVTALETELAEMERGATATDAVPDEDDTRDPGLN